MGQWAGSCSPERGDCRKALVTRSTRSKVRPRTSQYRLGPSALPQAVLPKPTAAARKPRRTGHRSGGRVQ